MRSSAAGPLKPERVFERGNGHLAWLLLDSEFSADVAQTHAADKSWMIPLIFEAGRSPACRGVPGVCAEYLVASVLRAA